MPTSSSKAKISGSKKLTWLETTAELIARSQLLNNEPYDHNQVYTIIRSMKTRKPLCKCKIQCLKTEMKVKRPTHFGQNPPRKHYSYKDIQRFYSFADCPDVLVLGCTDSVKKMKHYDFYRMDENQLQDLCHLIERAHSHPLCMLTDEENAMVRYNSSQSSLAGENEVSHGEDPPEEQNQSHTEIQDHPGSVGDEFDYSFETSEASKSAKEPTVEGEDQPDIVEEVVEIEEPIQPAEAAAPLKGVTNGLSDKPDSDSTDHKVPRRLVNDPLFEKLTENVDDSDILSMDMQYIDVNPSQGNRIAQIGGVYMFVAHHKRSKLPNPAGDDAYSAEEDAALNSADRELTVSDLSSSSFSSSSSSSPNVTELILSLIALSRSTPGQHEKLSYAQGVGLSSS
ncbi:unnamed protein product [Calicophoron daubneyi]|uniref:Trematode PH-like domain-containing protein n=1 Tax=Calicophoron daubneyi TaxID=300641 RepID=A0AAV2TQ98_CALDB